MSKTTEKEKLNKLADLLKIPVEDVEQLVEKELQRVNRQAELDRLVEKAADGTNPFEASAGGEAEAESDDLGEEAELAGDEEGEMDMEMAEPSSLFSPDELAEIATAIGPIVAGMVVEAIMPALDMEARFGKMIDDIKSIAMPPAPAGEPVTKEAEEDPKIAALQQQLDLVTKELSELKGDQPEGYFRPSQHGSGLFGEILGSLVDAQKKTKQADPHGLASGIDDVVDLIVPPAVK
jgi:hypothetical protein